MFLRAWDFHRPDQQESLVSRKPWQNKILSILA